MNVRTILSALIAVGFLGFSTQISANSDYTQPIQIAANSTSDRVFVFDPSEGMWYAYEDGKLVKSGVASGGANYCADLKRSCYTPVGMFKLSSKRGSDCVSSRYPLGKGGAPMNYCMFFNGGYAIHASNDVPAGRNASHGCIRVKYDAAKWLNQDFLKVGDTVIVKPY